MPIKLLKSLLGIAAVLGFVLLGVIISRHSSHPLGPFTNQLDLAQEITLQRDAAQVKLSRDGDHWRVGLGSATYKADPDRVNIFIQSLQAVRLEDVITERADRAGDFDLHPASATVITLWSDKGTPLVVGAFGKQAPDRAHVYFQYPVKPQIYLARGVMHADGHHVDLNGWRDRTIIGGTEDNVLTLYIEGPGFKTALARSSDTWTNEGRVVDSTPVWGLLGVLTHLKADDFIDNAPVSAVHSDPLRHATVTLQLRDGTNRVLHIGRLEPKSKRHPVSVDDNADRFWINAAAVQSILQKPSEFKSLTKKS